MADLSKAQTRVPQSDRQTSRRDSIIPSRRNIEAPQRRAAADIRSGTRGDTGGADALLDMARQLNGTANAFADRQGVLDKKNNIENTIQGGLDFQGGVVDPEKLTKSLAYRAAVTSSQAEVTVSNWTTETKTGLQELMTTLSPFDLEGNEKTISDYIDAQKKNLIVDEDGKTRDFGSPEAAYKVINDLARRESELRAAALEDNQKNVENFAINSVGQALTTRLMNGEPVDFETTIGALPASIRGKGRDVLFENARLAANQLEAKGKFARADQIRLELGDSYRLTSTKAETPALVSDGGGVTRNAADSVPTGELPAKGAITNTYTQHQGRGSKGLDIDGKIGDAVTAPAGGTVKKAGYDAKSGYYVIIDHGNGVESSYSHLNKFSVKEGDTIASGVTLGEIGNSGRVSKSGGGDGSHLHYRVKVKGKDVDPQTHRYTASTPRAAPAATGGMPLVDAMFSEGEPQVAAVEEPQTPRLIPITEGTVYSLTVEQRALIASDREAGRSKAEQFAEKQENERFEQGTKQVFAMFVENNPPSPEQIRKFVEDGDIPANVGYQFIQTLQANADRVEAKADSAQAKAEENYATKTAIALTEEEINLRAGQGPSTPAGFWAMIATKRARGELGPAKQEPAALAGLYSAWEAGRNEVLSRPSYKAYGDAVANLFAPKTGVAGARGAGANPSLKAAAMDEYTRLTTKEGMSGPAAFAEVRKKYATNTDTTALSSVQARKKALEAERGK